MNRLPCCYCILHCGEMDLCFTARFVFPHRPFLSRTVLPVPFYTHTHPHTHKERPQYSGIRPRRAERVLTENNMSVKAHSLLCVFKPKKHNPLKEKGGLSLHPPFFPSSLFPSCSLSRSFLPLVHASGIPLDPLNEGHIAGLAKRGEWERRRGVTKKIE